MAKTPQYQINAQKRYDDANCIRITIKFHKTTDADILAAIDESNKQGSLKKMLRMALKEKEGD